VKNPYVLDQRGYSEGDPGTPKDRPNEIVPTLSAEKLAAEIASHKKWPGSKNVVLYSCSTGDGGKASFAKKLAKLLKVPVYAPTDVLYMKKGSPDSIDNNGKFERFEP
jgi:hypothetical protein